MNLKGTSGWALLLIGSGLLIILSKLGFGLGFLLNLSFPIILILLGYLGLKHKRSVVGWLLLIIGLGMLIGKLSGLATFLLAALFICWGYALLKRKTAY